MNRSLLIRPRGCSRGGVFFGLLLCLISSVRSPAIAAPTGPMVAWVAQLKSADKLTCRMAQIQLGHQGKAALRALEKQVAGADQLTRTRLAEVVSLMLLQTVELTDLDSFPGLRQVCQSDFDRARQKLSVLFAAKRYDSGERGYTAPGYKPSISPTRRAIASVRLDHGWAVPAALELCRDPEAPSRIYGIELLSTLEAVGQRQTVDRLGNDQSVVAVFHGCYSSPETVSQIAKRLLPASSARRGGPFSYQQAEGYVGWLTMVEFKPLPVSSATPARPGAPRGIPVLGGRDYELIGRLRQEGKCTGATSWENYWKRAKPVLGQYLKRS